MESSAFHSEYLINEEQDEEDASDQRLVSENNKGQFREQDIYLPIANVARIMKNAVPSNGKIAKDAKECVQECVSEFISFITSEASERCAQEKRKTINGEDILFAMATLGFDPYIEPLKVYLQKYRDTLKAEKGAEGFQDGGHQHVVAEQDIVEQFGQNQFADMLVATEPTTIVASPFVRPASSSLDPSIQFT